MADTAEIFQIDFGGWFIEIESLGGINADIFDHLKAFFIFDPLGN